MACRIGATGHLSEMARPGHYASLDGAGDSLPRLRGPAPRLLDLRRRSADRRRSALGLAPRRGMGRRRPAAVLCRACADAPSGALRPDRLRALLSRARSASDRRVGEPAARSSDRRGRRECCRLGLVVLLPRRFATRRSAAGGDGQDRLLRRLCHPPRHPGGDEGVADRVHRLELAAGRADARRPVRPTCVG